MIKNTLTEEGVDDTADLKKWIQQALNELPDIVLNGSLLLIPLSGDAGFRRYYRLNSKPSLLAVTAPANSGTSESAAYFANLSHALRQCRITVPDVLAYRATDNYMLLEDFGDRIFFNELNNHTADYLYRKALTQLIKLQKMPRDKVNIPQYDQTLLVSEMEFFREWFVSKLLGYPLSMQEQQLIDRTFTFLAEQALAQPQVFVHRDYHSRNLLVREGTVPGIIDFQDAVWGPATYDVVSLLRDCYLRWPLQKVENWAIGYADMAMESEVMPKVSHDQFVQWFDTMGLQRHIKVLGIFARLWLRDNKPQYLNDLPLVLRYTIEIAERYRETRSLAIWLSTFLLDSIEKQSWYRDYRTAGDRK